MQLPAIFRRGECYRRTFLDANGGVGPFAEVVLADLRTFCRLDSPTVCVSPATGTIDPVAMALAEGRREVLLRILKHLRMPPESLDRLNQASE